MWVVKLVSFVLFVLGATSFALAPIGEPRDTNPMRDDGFSPKWPDMSPSPEAR